MPRSRTLTVVVADVVASTELFGRLGVDRADDARRALFTAFADAIAAGNGMLIKTMGDGCLASFDSAADAVTAAIALQHSGARLRDRKVPGLGLRVGVAVGDVTEEDDDVFGPAVVAASRLCSAAGEHQILATDMVRMLAGDRGNHPFESVGELVLKGIAEPLPACAIRVDAEASRGPPLPAALAATPAEVMVGRGAELDVLSAAFMAASGGERRAVLVAGEPGVGKTRLVAALARHAHDEGALVLFGRCEEDLPVAYQPFAEALRTGFAGLSRQVLTAHVAAHGGEIRRLVPAVEGPEPVLGDPALEQARLFDAVADLLRRAAEDQPVVLVLDDLHWAAPSTTALLRHLLRVDPITALCVLGTYRDTEVDRAHALGAVLADIHRTTGVARLALRGLDEGGLEDLVAALSGDDLDDDGRVLASALAERTNGNPFFANQVLRHLAERGVFVQDGGRWTVSGSLEEIDLPEGVLDVVGRRLSGLSTAANEALAVASLCGLEFGARVLSAVPEAGTPDAVIDGLDEAVGARLLVETGPGRFAFAHAIVRDALERELTMVRRARLHRALGEATLAVYGDTPDLPVAELARHFTEAAVLGDTAAAARWATAAARAAADQADQRAAIAVLERALAVIEAVEPVDQAARFDVAAALGERHFALLEMAEADAVRAGSAGDAARRLRSGERMLRIAMAAGPTPVAIDLCEGAIRLLESEAPLRALALATRAWLRCCQGVPGFTNDVEAAMALLPDLDASAPKVAAGARWMLAHATLGSPGAPRRLRVCDDALAVDPEAEDPQWNEIGSGMDVDMAGELLICRRQSLLALGLRPEFETGLTQLEALAEASGRIGQRSAFHGHVAGLALLDGRFGEVPTAADRVLEVAPDNWLVRATYFALSGRLALEEGRFTELLPMVEAAVTDDPSGPWIQAWLGRCRLGTGDVADATETLDHLARGWAGWARDFNWPGALADIAELVAELGSTGHAGLLAGELEPYSGELAVPGFGLFCLGAFDRYRGMLLSLLGRHDEAVAALAAGLVLEQSVDSPPLTARTRYWLARALLRRDGAGDRQRAEVELGRSIETAEKLGMAGLAAAGRELAKTGD